MEQQRKKANSRKLNFIILMTFVLLAVFINVKHEIWRDEAQAFLIARDFKNFSDFIYIMHHEGSPYLWHIILIPFAKLGFPIFTEKAITLILSVCSAYLVIYKSSFNYVHKILIILGYYFIYEYTAISRSYSLSLFFILLLAYLYKYRFEKTRLYLFTIFLFCNSNIHSTIIGFFIFLDFVYTLLKTGKLREKKFEIILSIFGFVLIFLEVLPANDIMNSLKAVHCSDILDGYNTAAVGLLAAFLPIPNFKINFWNSLYMYNFATYYYGLIVYGFVLRIFYKNKSIFQIFVLSTLTLIAFFILEGIPGVRHTGIIYLSFLYCLWIIMEEKQCEGNFNAVFIYVLLLLQVFSAGVAVNYDVKYNFSNAQYAADYIESNISMNDTVIMNPSSYGASIIADFNNKNRKLYYFQNDGLGSYTIWNQQYEDIYNLGQDKIFVKLQKYMAENNKKKVYLILNQELIVGSENYKSTLMYKAQNSIANEDYYIYKIQWEK